MIKSEPTYSLFKIVLLNIDLFLGIIITYTLTLETICYFMPYLTYNTDKFKNGSIFIQVYLLVFNVGDAVGKLIPERFYFYNTKYLNLFNFLRILLFHIYFNYVIYAPNPSISGYVVTRIIAYFIIGVTGGYLTNNYFCSSSRRFMNTANTDKTGSVILLGLIVGVVLGTILGYVWALKTHD